MFVFRYDGGDSKFSMRCPSYVFPLKKIQPLFGALSHESDDKENNCLQKKFKKKKQSRNKNTFLKKKDNNCIVICCLSKEKSLIRPKSVIIGQLFHTQKKYHITRG